MPLKLDAAQWRAFMRDEASWPKDRHIEEYILVHRGRETYDLADADIADDDVIEIREGTVRDPSPDTREIDLLRLAMEFLARRNSITEILHVERDHIEGFVEGCRANGVQAISLERDRRSERTSGVRLMGAEWDLYRALQAPDWPEDGTVVDCHGTLNGQRREDLDTVTVAPHDDVGVEGGSIVSDRPVEREIPLLDHLSAWLSLRPQVTFLVRCPRAAPERFAAVVSLPGVSPHEEPRLGSAPHP